MRDRFLGFERVLERGEVEGEGSKGGREGDVDDEGVLFGSG